jgi:hypothetical protein
VLQEEALVMCINVLKLVPIEDQLLVFEGSKIRPTALVNEHLSREHTIKAVGPARADATIAAAAAAAAALDATLAGSHGDREVITVAALSHQHTTMQARLAFMRAQMDTDRQRRQQAQRQQVQDQSMDVNMDMDSGADAGADVEVTERAMGLDIGELLGMLVTMQDGKHAFSALRFAKKMLHLEAEVGKSTQTQSQAAPPLSIAPIVVVVWRLSCCLFATFSPIALILVVEWRRFCCLFCCCFYCYWHQHRL